MYVDTHAHLSSRQFAAELPQVIDRASTAGVTTIVTVATDLPDAQRVVEIAGCHAGVFAAVGLHPGEVPQVSISQMPELRELAAAPKVVAIGETGLDYYREARNDPALQQQQKELFRAHLELAEALTLPVIIHNRAADADMLAILRTHRRAQRPWGVLHCFASDQKFADECRELGLLISYTGILTFTNATGLHAVAGHVPLEQVLLETDAPYLAPVPHRGKRNEPAYVPLVAAALAQIKGVSVAEVARVTTSNAGRLFRWGGS